MKTIRKTQLCILSSYSIPQKQDEKRTKERGDEERGEKKVNKPYKANKKDFSAEKPFLF